MLLGDLLVRVVGDTSPLEKDVGGMGSSPAIAKGGRRAGDLFVGAVKSSTNVLGPATGALFAEGINNAAQFSDQIATIDTVAGKGASALAGLDKGALQLSKDTGKPIEDITAGLYDLVSAGVPAGDAMGVLTASTNLAIGGLGTTAQAVDAVTSAMNAYGLKATDATHITDVFAKAVQDGKVTTAQIGESIATIAPIAAQAGISLEEVSAGYAQLTAKGVPAAEAATQMRSAIVALLSPNAVLNRIQGQTGINFAKLAKEKGLSVALNELRKTTDETGKTFDAFNGEMERAKGPDAQAKVIAKYRSQLGLTKAGAEALAGQIGKKGLGVAMQEFGAEIGAGNAGLSNALGRVEAYNFALSSTSGSAEGAVKTLGALQAALTDTAKRVESGKAKTTEFDDVLGDFADELGLSKDEAKAFADEVRTKGIGPAMDDIKKKVGGAGGNFEAFQAQIQETMGASGLAAEQASIKMDSPVEAGKRLAASFKVLSIQAFGPFADSLGPMVVGLNQAGGAMSALIRPATLVGGLVGKLASVIVTSILGLVAPAATAGETVGAATSGGIALGAVVLPALLIAAVVAAIIAVVHDPSLVGKALDIGKQIIGFIIDGVVGFGKLLVQRFAEIFANVGGAIGPGLGEAVKAVGDFVGSVVEAIAGIPAAAIGWVADLIGQVVDAGVQFLDAVVGFVGQVVVTILSIPVRIAQAWIAMQLAIAGFVVQAIGAFVAFAGQVVGVILAIPGQVASWVASLIGQAAALVAGIIANVIRGAGMVVGAILSIPGRIVSWVGSIVGQAARMVAGFIANVVRGAGIVVSTILSIPGRIISWVASIAGQVASLAGNLVGKVAELTGSIVGFFLGIPGRIAGIGVEIVKGIIGGMAALPGQLADVVGNAFANLKIDIGPFHLSAAGVSIDLPHIDLPHFAAGVTNFRGGTALVGEEGPELVNLSPGADVIPNDQLANIKTTDGGDDERPIEVNVYNPTPEPASTSTKRELRKLQVAGSLR